MCNYHRECGVSFDQETARDALHTAFVCVVCRESLATNLVNSAAVDVLKQPAVQWVVDTVTIHIWVAARPIGGSVDLPAHFFSFVLSDVQRSTFSMAGLINFGSGSSSSKGSSNDRSGSNNSSSSSSGSSSCSSSTRSLDSEDKQRLYRDAYAPVQGLQAPSPPGDGRRSVCCG